ncbi:hypothetical protein KUCAC02_031704 [Chaenocephalus aceratus]|nr:hypothetical protein KUCAC02_031704 [Chaenocephalus aceratus]
MDQSAERPTHNYSIQTYNSTELEKELLRKEMAMVPGRRFTYSQQYQSGYSSSGGAEEAMEGEHPSCKHIKADTFKGRLGLEPALCEDFHLLSKPPPVFSPTSINLAGEPLHQEQLEAARTQYCRWMKKLLPQGNGYPACNSHIPEFKCLIGGNSERIQEILKDEPNTYSLRKEGMALKPSPELSARNLDDSKDERKRSGALAPGPCVDLQAQQQRQRHRETHLSVQQVPLHGLQKAAFVSVQADRPASDGQGEESLHLSEVCTQHEDANII